MDYYARRRSFESIWYLRYRNGKQIEDSETPDLLDIGGLFRPSRIPVRLGPRLRLLLRDGLVEQSAD